MDSTKKGGSRIVLDLTAPVRLDKSFVLLPQSTVSPPVWYWTSPPSTVRHSCAPSPLTIGRGPTLEVLPSPPATARHDSRPVIVLDPGHGGIDEGAHAATGEAEKSVVLDFALMLRDKLEQTGKYHIEMTRSDDVHRAHGPGSVRPCASGTTLHLAALRCARARGRGRAGRNGLHALRSRLRLGTARLAEVENRADIIAGVDLSSEPNEIADILIDLAQRETRSFTTHFARALVGDLKNAIRLHKQPLRSAGFRVLKAPDVPSVLIELGFVSNRADFKELMSETWRARAADSITHAVNDYFSRRMAGAPRAVGRE